MCLIEDQHHVLGGIPRKWGDDLAHWGAGFVFDFGFSCLQLLKASYEHDSWWTDRMTRGVFILLTLVQYFQSGERVIQQGERGDCAWWGGQDIPLGHESCSQCVHNWILYTVASRY